LFWNYTLYLLQSTEDYFSLPVTVNDYSMYGNTQVSYPVLRTSIFSGFNLHYDASDANFQASSVDSVVVSRTFSNIDQSTEQIVGYKLWS